MITKMQDIQNSAEEYLESLKEYNVNPLWTVMKAAVPPEPNPKAKAHIWKYNAMRPKLLEAASLIHSEEAERRVLMLTNPSMSGVYTSDTIYAGLQIINPGEVAPAHRHSAFALRFIVEGEKGFTAVEGQKIPMERGDVILTPSWQWHDHGHEGDSPMIWLDGLDLPLFQAFPVNFAEDYSEPRYPSKPVQTSPLRLPWEMARKALDEAGDGYAKYEYPINNSSGPLSRTLGAEAERVPAGRSSAQRRENASFVFHVFGGTGRTLLDGHGALEWGPRDTFVIPSWVSFRHEANPGENTYIFSFTDAPILKALGVYRKE